MPKITDQAKEMGYKFAIERMYNKTICHLTDGIGTLCDRPLVPYLSTSFPSDGNLCFGCEAELRGKLKAK